MSQERAAPQPTQAVASPAAGSQSNSMAEGFRGGLRLFRVFFGFRVLGFRALRDFWASVVQGFGV